MDSQLTADETALHLFFTDDVYLVNEPVASYDRQEAVADEHAAKAVVSPAVAFEFLGKNKRNILILVSDEHNEVSDEAGRELLRKIMKSVNLTANDFALLNYAKYKSTDFKQLQEYFSCKLVLAFGVTPAQLSLTSAHPVHAIIQEGDVKMIFSSALEVLHQDPAGKKALWGILQNLGL